MEYRGYRVLYGDYSTVKILNMGKGALPKALSGAFTSQTFATKAIDAHLDSKGSADGKADVNSGD